MSDDEAALAINRAAEHLGAEPYTFLDSEGYPWAVLLRYDDYCALTVDASNMGLIRALTCDPPAEE